MIKLLNNKYFIILLIILLIILGFVFFKLYFFKYNKSQNIIETKREIVLQNSKIYNYELQQKNKIKLEDLPQNLGFLLIKDLKNTSVFNDQNNKYLIKGQFIDKDLLSVYNDLMIYFRNLNFEILSGSRNEEYALLELRYYDIILKIILNQNQIEKSQNIVNCEIYVL